MKRALAALAMVGMLAGGAEADLYWDSNGVAAGAGATPTGVWGTSDFWSADPNGEAAPGAWTSGETAAFAAGADATGDFTVDISGTQEAGGVRVEEGNVTLSGGTINLAGTPTLSVASGSTLVMGSTVTGVGPSSIVGGGIVRLTNTANANSGAISVSGGSTLRIASSAAIGATGADSGNITLDGGTFQNEATGAGISLVTGNRGFVIGAGGGTIDVPGSISNIQIYASGSITGAGNTLTKAGPGILRMTTPTSITFTKLVVTGGLYQAGLDTHFGASPASALADAITLNGGGISTNAGFNLNANRGITLGPLGGTINTPSAPTVGGVISGVGSLTKTGASTLTLTDSGNSYEGGTTIQAGTLAIDGDATLGNGNGTLILAGGRLNATASRTPSSNPIPNPINLTANSSITTTSSANPADLNFTSNSISGTGGTLTFRNEAISGTSVFDPRFSGSGFDFGRPIVLAAGSTDANRTTRLSSFNTTGATQTFSGVISGPGSYRRTSTVSGTGGDTILSGANTYSGGTALNGGFIGFGASTTGSEGAIDSGPIGTGPMTVANDATVGFFASGGPRTVANPVTVNTNNLTIKGSHDLEMSGAVNLGGGVRAFNVSNTGSTAFSGVISNGGLTMAGDGALTLKGANDYADGTIINDGVVYASNAAGSATGSGAVTVNNGGTLAGTGSVAGVVNVNAGGTLAPGASIESLNTGALSLASGAILQVELDSSASPAVGADLVNASGGLTLTAGATLVLADVAATSTLLPVDTKLTLVRYDATAGWNNVAFVGYADDSTFTLGANTFKIDYNDATGGVNFGGGDAVGGGFLTLLANPAAVPEASAAMFGVLACCLAGGVQGWRRLRRRQSGE